LWKRRKFFFSEVLPCLFSNQNELFIIYRYHPIQSWSSVKRNSTRHWHPTRHIESISLERRKSCVICVVFQQ
jgi:hypothetical protein